ncbi:Acg family FMN-binding oxidoreductase [Jatrophihabitans fulvus]
MSDTAVEPRRRERTRRAAVQRAVQRAVQQAVLAPSVHNTQPWRFELYDDHVDLVADTSRSLRVLDPRRRQLTISCGCALLNLRASLAADQVAAEVIRFPDRTRPTLLARVSPLRDGGPEADEQCLAADGDAALATLAPAVAERRTVRRALSVDPMPPSLLADLVRDARAKGAGLALVAREDQRAGVAAVGRLADDIETEDEAYRTELERWVTDDPRRRDGVPLADVPSFRPSGVGRHESEFPLRAYDARGVGRLPSIVRPDANQHLLVLWTDEDDPHSWLRAGEALERVWLRLTLHGYGVVPVTQPVEVRGCYALLRRVLSTPGHPHLLLRVGRAAPVPATPRRALDDVVERLPPIPTARRRGAPAHWSALT